MADNKTILDTLQTLNPVPKPYVDLELFAAQLLALTEPVGGKFPSGMLTYDKSEDKTPSLYGKPLKLHSHFDCKERVFTKEEMFNMESFIEQNALKEELKKL